MPLGPCRHLSVDQALLDGGRQRHALGDRETKVLRPLRLLLEYRHFRGATRGAVVVGDLKENLHAHGEPRSWSPAGELSTTTGMESWRLIRRADPPLLWPTWAF
jgi:hypothetical protein